MHPAPTTSPMQLRYCAKDAVARDHALLRSPKLALHVTTCHKPEAAAVRVRPDTPSGVRQAASR